MLVLGIETSCDETAVSVVENGRHIRANVVSSSLNFHKRYKGVVPEIASRLQLESIVVVLADAIEQAGVSLKDIKLIAVTSHPGLSGSLLVGNCFARALGFAQGIPLIAVDHLQAHLYSGFFNRHKPNFPFVGLVVSGGHTSLFYLKSFTKIKLLGLTQDDACGEAFDKVATILGLGYPGGPLIEKLAKQGNRNRINFRCSNTQNPLNFSFSGIKTAVLYKVEKLKAEGKNGAADVAASFQEAVIDALVDKTHLACKLKKANQLVIGGGVAANNRLREKFMQAAEANNLDIYFSPKEFCTDNAAMVAGLGYWLFKGVGK
ncbi:MAG: tRNA (adenosine(37)-N6)-threonylcarbamoyltransferase complex transferase subunit TsaD [Candidatus Omnitrophota bacterium]|jgi:N6-L-threonylcarbamoyladenine synthase